MNIILKKIIKNDQVLKLVSNETKVLTMGIVEQLIYIAKMEKQFGIPLANIS